MARVPTNTAHYYSVSSEKPREIAVRVLRKAQTSPVFIETLLEEELSRSPVSALDRRLAQELTYGIIRWQATLDWLISQKTASPSQQPPLQVLLRLGLYQIFFLQRIPDHAAVHETVELAKRLGFGRQSGFLNALLRNYVREKESTRLKLKKLQESNLSLGYSHPAWLCERWEKRLGREQTVQLLNWNNSPPPTFVRVNSLRMDPGKLLEQWREENVEYDFFRSDWVEENLCFLLKSHPPLSQLPSFQQGGFYVQDPSTLLAVTALDPHPKESILDLCAAPGGKTTYIAQRMENQGFLLAQDLHPKRLAMIQENCARLGVTCVETSRPAEGMIPELTRQFDRILVDAPCSNTGVMRRRVELRWRIKPEEISNLTQTQMELLELATKQLKPGGRLVYSTCSLEPEENQDLIRQFLSRHPELKLTSERELTPFLNRVDGAYVATMGKE